MTSDATTYYRTQIAAYTDSIRMADFKANVAIIYGAFTIGPILGFSKNFPPFLPLPAALLPFVVVFSCLLVCLLPRYPRAGRATLPISRNATPDDFHVPDSWAVTVDQQQTLCLILCNILYWKALLLRVSVRPETS